MTFLLASTLASICGMLLLAIRLWRVGSRPKGLPPGPPTMPILGNLHQLPKRGIHLQLQKWAKEYGPIYSIMLGTQVTIMINRADVAKELLERRSAIWSSRPELYMAMTVMGSGLRFNLMVSLHLSPVQRPAQTDEARTAIRGSVAHDSAHQPRSLER
jgi:hypothetical protein